MKLNKLTATALTVGMVGFVFSLALAPVSASAGYDKGDNDHKSYSSDYKSNNHDTYSSYYDCWDQYDSHSHDNSSDYNNDCWEKWNSDKYGDHDTNCDDYSYDKHDSSYNDDHNSDYNSDNHDDSYSH
jgi:hypothetical protein